MDLSIYNEKINDALLHAFYSEAELRRLLRFDLQANLEVIAGPGPLRQRVEEVTQWAEAEGKFEELFLAAMRRKPGNPQLKGLAAELADKVTSDCQQAAERASGYYVSGIDNPQADQYRAALQQEEPSPSGLQALIVNAPHLNTGQEVEDWSLKNQAARKCVCFIAAQSGAHGTGFLIGNDRIVTNAHVIGPGSDLTRFQAVFDYTGSKQWKNLPPYAFTSVLASSGPRECDYTILQLQTVPPGQRDYLRPSKRQLSDFREPVLVLGHPNGVSLRYSMGVVFDVIGYLGRVAYSANTAPGSSGSPVFSENWGLVALHHHGEANVNNHGITMTAIADDLKKKQLLHLVEPVA